MMCCVLRVSVGCVRIFQQQSNALTAADAGRGNAIARTAPAHLTRGRNRQPHTGGGQRMAHGNGATVDVEFAAIKTEFSFDGNYLRPLRFIDFKAADVIQRQTTALQQQTNGRRRADTHDFWRHTYDGGGYDTGQGFAIVTAHVAAGGNDGCRRSIDQRRAVAAGLHAVRIKRAQLGQHFYRRRTRVSVLRDFTELALQFQMAVVVAIEFEGFVGDGNDLVDVEAFLLCAYSTLERERRILIDGGTRDAVFFGQILGRLRHG